MLHLVRQIWPWTVAGAAPDDLVGVGDIEVILGVGVGEHPAFVDHIVPSLRPPQLHGVPPPFVVGGQLHQAQIGPVVAVYIGAADSEHYRAPLSAFELHPIC